MLQKCYMSAWAPRKWMRTNSEQARTTALFGVSISLYRTDNNINIVRQAGRGLIAAFSDVYRAWIPVLQN